MISLEQIRTLESKIETAVSKINALTQENESLKTQLESYRQEQQQIAQIEQGILHALERLGSVESTIHGLTTSAADVQEDMFSVAPSSGEQNAESNNSANLSAAVNEPQQFDNIY